MHETTAAPPRPVAWYGDWYRPDPEPPKPPAPPEPQKPARRPAPERQPAPDPSSPQEPTGLILGRFLPPHRGHQFLVDYARASVPDLTVFLCSAPDDPIPATARLGWMRELFPDVRLIHEATEGEPRSWDDWEAAVRKHLPAGVGYLFASEPKARELAERLEAEFVCVDPGRRAVPVSGTAIRQAPLRHWDFLPDCVRPWYVRRVCLAGAEGSGKSTLARRLASHYGTVCVDERARALAEERGGVLTLADLERAARGQLAAEAALARQARRLLVCDTDAAAVALWAERLHGTCPAWLRGEALRRRHDLVLVLSVEDSWAGGVGLDRAHERSAFQDRLLADLDERGQRWQLLRGTWHERFAAACTAIDRLLVEA